jgi:hypothetical protein
MEVAPKQDSVRKSEPAPQAEYVGALRGAAPAKIPEPRRTASRRVARTGPSGAQAGQSSSSGIKAIVVGAATAAIVSSIIAAGMGVWTSDGKRSGGDGRMTFYAPGGQSGASPSGVAAPGNAAGSPPSTTPSLPIGAQPLLQRADAYLHAGKPEEARLVLEEAARAGSGVAALTLGAMYDPGRAAQFANFGIKADPDVARTWYERAKDLGVAEANDRLAELATK